MSTQSSSLRLAERLVKHPYTWPGGYPLYAITGDGGALCRNCCKQERECIATTTGNDGWNIVALQINWEAQELFCDHCSSQIESAYSQEET